MQYSDLSESKLLKEVDAAKYLSCSPNTLRKQRSDGERENHIPIVPFIKLGKMIRYSIDDLDSYIEQHRVQGLEV